MPNVRGPYFAIRSRKPSATRSSASSQLAARCSPFSRISGRVRRVLDGIGIFLSYIPGAEKNDRTATVTERSFEPSGHCISRPYPLQLALYYTVTRLPIALPLL